MVVRLPDSLGDAVSMTPVGWRLAFAPNVVGDLARAAGVIFRTVCGLAVASAIVVLAPIAWLAGTPLAWRVAPILAAALGIVAVGLAAVAGYTAVSTVRLLELDRSGPAGRLLVTRLRRVAVLPLENLERISVVRRLRGHEQVGIDVVLNTADRRVTCSVGVEMPLGRVEPLTLAGWLIEDIGPVGVAVECQTVQLKPLEVPSRCWTAQEVAAEWGVPIADVPGLALVWDVPFQLYMPRAAVHLSDPYRYAQWVYEPDDVRAMAATIRAARPDTGP